MNDKDITKLATKLTISLATKEDFNGLRKELKVEIKALHEKADTILKFAENVDEVTENHEKRITKLEKHLRLPSQSITA